MIVAQPNNAASFSPMGSASISDNKITAMLRAWSDGEDQASEALSALFTANCVDKLDVS